MSKTEILSVDGGWSHVVDDSRATVGKEELGHEPSTAFKQRILLAEHSPIRDLTIRWKWSDIPSWVATHWSRHKFEKFIKTQRTDRTGVDRKGLPQDAPVTFTGNANAQNLIDAWRKRLCHQASPETRAYAVDFKKTLHEVEPELADVLVCNCCYRGGCPEMAQCGFWDAFKKKHPDIDYTSIRARYDAYNADFYGGDEDGKHKIVLLVGRSGSGKTAIANYLKDTYGWKAVDSYTTRPKRVPWEVGHTFVSDDEFDALTDMVAYTEFDGHRYCATAEQVDNADIYIVDLAGVKTMKELYHGDSVLLPVYVDVNPALCMYRMRKRGDSFESAWQRRWNDDAAFAGAKDYLNANFDAVLSVKNRRNVSEAGDMIYKWATI